MDRHIVNTRGELGAAIKAAAQPTLADARDNPFTVVCGTTKYTFKEGVTERRADTLLRRISKVPKRHFEVR
jgi:hypothetical protein